ncbi:endonuclease/exonuclease/phosphatase family protein [Christiangramia salexigens]|uniref:Endonuclease/exonuclease/phosphatase n=1 Tax=Christiangramia salexigens TaxID=1913577 RepID=A0A1L3J8Q4_9FLAO|nr:endonuclease/exonuclease/phosphatase family protein [Christiangramia salexigens]APG61490.1 endonuclease/exonuclease/phosphatase [Christiangramia salexigens]
MNKFIYFLSLFICLQSSSQELEIMSYNIKYANENDGENSWSKRKDFLTNQLKYYEPDIIGIQEAVIGQLKHITSEIDTYAYVGVGRDDGKQKGEYSAILYNTRKFKVLDSKTFWLSETPEKVSVGWDAAMERICTYALFIDEKTDREFWVFNTHFDHIGEEARAQSTKLILKKISEINSHKLPVVLTGDFNLEPDSDPILDLKRSLKDSRTSATQVSFGSEGTFNGFNFGAQVTRRIDYIFVSPEVKVLKYGALSDSKDLKYPSDHFPIISLISF